MKSSISKPVSLFVFIIVLTCQAIGFAEVVEIPDPNLRAALESALGKNSGDAITDTELATLTVLPASSSLITDLTGLEHCTGLTNLYLIGNQISDITSVANLPNLTTLYLQGNPLTAVALPIIEGLQAGGTTVEYDEIAVVEVEVNIPDPNLRAVLESALGKSPGDAITDAELVTLTVLNAVDPGIVDLTGLEYCTGLTSLDLMSNEISDISAVSNLTALTRLDLGDNEISDISPLTGLSNLTWLMLRGNPLNTAAYITVIPALQAHGANVTFDANTAPVANAQEVTMNQEGYNPVRF